MDENNEVKLEKEKLDDRQWLWKTLKPAGCIFVLVLAAIAIVMCFTNGRDPIPGYEPAESMEYYEKNPEAFLAELKENVLPHLDGVESAAVKNGRVCLELSYDDFVISRSALLQYFDESLFELVQLEK